MSWLLLFALTAVVVLLPMLPALIEWRRPSDVTPLFIGEDDALDPGFLARSFASRLAEAQALRKSHLGRSPIASLQPDKAWPWDARESATCTSRRVWDLHGDADLPAGMAFLGEVAARGSLRTAARGLYRALWVRDRLHLAPGSTVLRWAHARQVDAGPDCDLAGRTSADESITLARGTRFVLLHAPALRFAPTRVPSTLPPVAGPATGRGLPAAVDWHAASESGRCASALAIAAGSAWRGDLVCGADLQLGAGCSVQGSLKAHGTLTLGAGCTVHGSVVSRGPIRLEAGCCVRGAVVSETAIVLGEGCVIGLPGMACTVAAPHIEIAAGVLAHGTVWASVSGLCNAVDNAEPAAAKAAPRARAEATAQEATA